MHAGLKFILDCYVSKIEGASIILNKYVMQAACLFTTGKLLEARDAISR